MEKGHNIEIALEYFLKSIEKIKAELQKDEFLQKILKTDGQ